MRRALALTVCSVLLSALAPGMSGNTLAKSPLPPKSALGDATVLAVIDFGFSPYHWDFLASKMPQHQDRSPSNDLPLSKAPHTWLPGFPEPGKAFSSYKKLNLSLDGKNASTPLTVPYQKDKPKWDAIRKSDSKSINYYWMPGTKVIGAITFGSGKIHAPSSAHGMGSTSVSTGNIHGTCPECLMFFVDLNGATPTEGEAAIDWVMDQPWIDAVTNSYGYSTAYRDRYYDGSSTGLQRRASDRGQTIFFSAGNGNDGSFVAPNSTMFSSQEGPDWIVTVGAVSPDDHASYTGAGKPADVAGIGLSYPAAYGATTVSGRGPNGFSGTSNATPTIAGTYLRALYLARVALPGQSRIQSGGVIARGPKYRCAAKRRKCELADGKLTAAELRTRLFHGAVHTPNGMTAGTLGGHAPPIGEEEFLNEGHGSYFARETGKKSDWLKEFARVIDPLLGRAKTLVRPDGEREYMIVDSYCRQHVWGSWKGGYYIAGKTQLPGNDPMYPYRSAWASSCETLKRPG